MLNKTFFRLVKNPPEEFKEFLLKKQADNKQLLEFFIAEPDEQTRKAHYAQGQQLWNSVGNALRGFITEALTKNNQGPYVGGNEPSETDCEFLGYTKGFSRCWCLSDDSPLDYLVGPNRYQCRCWTWYQCWWGYQEIAGQDRWWCVWWLHQALLEVSARKAYLLAVKVLIRFRRSWNARESFKTLGVH